MLPTARRWPGRAAPAATHRPMLAASSDLSEPAVSHQCLLSPVTCLELSRPGLWGWARGRPSYGQSKCWLLLTTGIGSPCRQIQTRPMRGHPKACQRERSFICSEAAKRLHPETPHHHLRTKPTSREQRDGERHCLGPWIKLCLKPTPLSVSLT